MPVSRPQHTDLNAAGYCEAHQADAVECRCQQQERRDRYQALLSPEHNQSNRNVEGGGFGERDRVTTCLTPYTTWQPGVYAGHGAGNSLIYLKITKYLILKNIKKINRI